MPKSCLNTDRIDIKESIKKKQNSKEPLPSVRSSQDEGTEISQSVVGDVCPMFQELLLASLRICHVCSSSLLVTMWQTMTYPQQGSAT